MCRPLEYVKKGILRTFNHPNPKTSVFQGFQDLENAVMNFKYIQVLHEPI